jgi:arsenate reductase
MNKAVTIYHNPKCGTSRDTLALIREAGIEPKIVEYLKEPPSRSELTSLIELSGGSARALLRAKEPLCAELKLDDPKAGDKRIVDAMLKHPILINRPIVATKRGVRLCRPPETVFELLPKPNS